MGSLICLDLLLISHSRHYSYECKATAQERPYTSRPSRTQQLLNPKLAPKLNSDVPNELLRKKGVADEQLAKAELERGGERNRASASPSPMASQSRKRSRSISSYSSNSVSTISTNRSISPKRARRKDEGSYFDSQQEPAETRARVTKRRYSSSPHSSSESRSISPDDYPYPSDRRRSSEANQRRRHRQISPERRGRPDSHRGASRRTKSRSLSLDRSRIAKERKSLTPASPGYSKADRRYPEYDRSEDYSTRIDGGENRRPGMNEPRQRKERSLSPYSKRLALTQSMNLG